MDQFNMGFEMNPNYFPEAHPGDPTNDVETHPEERPSFEVHKNSSTRMNEHGKQFRCQEQVRVLKEQMRYLKEIIMEGGGDTENPHGQPLSPGYLQEQVSNWKNLAEVTSERNAYLIRARALEDRIADLLSFGPGAGDAGYQDMIARRGSAIVERDQLWCRIDGPGGYISQTPSLKMALDPDAAEVDISTRMNTAIVKAKAAEADRDQLTDDNEDLKDRIDTGVVELQAVIEQRNSIQTQWNKLQAQLDALEDQGINIGEPNTPDEATRRTAKRESTELGQLKSGRQNESPLPAKVSEDCEQQLTLARSQRDSAIQQNEEARRNLATAKAERNGAHQRLKILEEEAKESIRRETQLRKELAWERERPQPDITIAKREENPCGKEQEEMQRLRDDLDFAIAEKSIVQVERDAAHIEIRGLEKEVANAHSAAEATNEVTLELRRSLAATNNAALAERNRAEEARKTQNKLRVERETCRIEANKLRNELAAAHQISRGLVRNGNIVVGDLIHVSEERDVALRNVARLQDALIKANDTVDLVQKQLDDCLARRGCEPANDLTSEEVNRIVAERDAALARVKELEGLLEELEEDYRKNLDQWERQTQTDERKISASGNHLKAQRKRTKDLAAQLKTAHTRSKAAESNAREAEASIQALEHRAGAAEARTLFLEIQIRQMQLDLDEANKTLSSDKGNRYRFGAEILRLGGTTIDPDSTVRPEGTWPDGPPLPSPLISMPPPPGGPDPSLIPHPPVAYAQPIPEDAEDFMNPFTYPPMLSEMKHHELHRGSVTTMHHLLPLNPHLRQKSISTRDTTRNKKGHNSAKDSPPLDHFNSSFSSPLTRLPGQSPIPPVHTSPTMSMRTSPRATRNPAPNYGGPGSGGGRKRKRKCETNSNKFGLRKRARGPDE